MEINWSTLTEKVGSDWLFGAALTGLVLATRKRMMSKAFSSRKTTVLTKALLAYQKKRQVGSYIYYVKRTIMYLGGATGADLAGEVAKQSSVARFGKGFIWGLCFLNFPIALLLASFNAGIGYLVEPQLLQLI